MSEKKMLTMNSRIKELYATPVGHDTIYKVLLQLNVPEKVVTNPLIGNLKLGAVARLTRKNLGEDFFEALLTLINSEKDEPASGNGPITKKWWKEAVFYQIYPRSFYDANGDGIGDLRGVIEKLDYLEKLGVNALWLSPIYDSPMDDNGYDIRDYRKILKDFGTMEDFEELLAKVHERGMHLIMDLVVNHTSDEHEWFQKALNDKDSKYRNYYFFRDGDGTKKAPNNWTSFFAGSAWNYYEQQDVWAMHLFSKKQMDLNWDNKSVRKDVIEMINWWLDKGVDGFRMDVINYISKMPGLPQGNAVIGSMMGYTGIEKYYYGPNLHKYLKEIHDKAFAPHDAFSVGETPGLGIKMCQLITGEERRELDMVFSFDHLETPGHIRFDDYEYDLNYLRDYLIDWILHYGNQCWMSLFYNNHDNPRMVSKVTKDVQYHTAIEKLLAVIQFTLKGTPFIFQGDEMGLTNYNFESIDEIGDVEAKGYYSQLSKQFGEKKAFEIIVSGTREHTRVLLPWNEAVKSMKPSMQKEISTEITETYKQLIALRRNEEALVYGDFEVLNQKKNRFVYKRSLKGREFIIDCNLSKEEGTAYNVSGQEGYKLLFPVASEASDTKVLKSYEARIWCKVSDNNEESV